MSDQVNVSPGQEITPHVVVVHETNAEPKVGDHIGQCKWWADKLGYGFLTIQNGQDKGKDIFVHHTGIKPLNSNYKTLKKGEYVNFDVVEGQHGLQAINVTGIGGGSLICDVNPYIRPTYAPHVQSIAHGFRYMPGSGCPKSANVRFAALPPPPPFQNFQPFPHSHAAHNMYNSSAGNPRNLKRLRMPNEDI